MPRERDIVVWDIEYLASLNAARRLALRPDYQRNAIWPAAAKSYLIDTLINDRPVPLIFLQPFTSPQTGLPAFAVVDGQQRLTAIFDYIDNVYRLSGPDIHEYRLQRFTELPPSIQTQILRYGMVVEVLRGYGPSEVREVFVRLNKYGVRLTPQELRHAEAKGVFKELVERVGGLPFWVEERFVSARGNLRMRADELAAELLILLAEAGPQDKKGIIGAYYQTFEDDFPEGALLEERLKRFVDWIRVALAGNRRTRFRKPVDLYALMGALDRLSGQGETLDALSPREGGNRLARFEHELNSDDPTARANRYLLAASRQTDNVGPRRARIDTLVEVIKPAV